MEINREVVLASLNGCNDILRSNHNKLSLPIILRISIKMTKGIKFSPIHVNENNIIVDGHHRYVSSVITGFELVRVNNYSGPSILNDLDWENVEFIEDDWDTPSKIQMLNEQDAKYNNMEIEEVEAFLNEIN